MDVVIRDRTDHLPAELRDYVESKTRGVGDYLDLVTSVDVEFDRDIKKRPQPLHVVKITVSIQAHRTSDIRVKETGPDQRATFDVALARAEAAAAQLKERIKAHP